MAYPYTSYQNPYQQGYYPYQMMQQPMQTQPIQQPVQQAPQTQQNYSPAINQSGIIWISGLQEAQMFPVGPNSAVALWQKDGKTIYLKQADATGRPTLTVYDLVERAETAQDNGNGQDGKVSDFATKEELGVVVGAVKDYSVALNTIKADIESLKTDMYGVAGKRKATRKQVGATEDDE